jgi:hypothetical protein
VRYQQERMSANAASLRTTTKFVDIGIGFGFLGLLFLNSFAPLRDDVYSKHSFALLCGVTFLALLMVVVRGRYRLAAVRRSPLLWYAMVLPLMLFSTLINFDALPADYVAGGINAVVFLATFVLCLILLTGSTRHVQSFWLYSYCRIMVVLGGAAALVALDFLLSGSSLFGPFRIDSASQYQGIRLQGWFSSPNTLVDVTALGTFSAAYLATRSHNGYGRNPSGRSVALYGCFAIFLTLATILTGSRGGVVSCFAGLGVGALAFTGLSIRKAIIRAVWLATLLAGAVAAITVAVYTTMTASTVSGPMQGNGAFMAAQRLSRVAEGGLRLEFWTQVGGELTRADIVRLLFGHGNGYVQVILGGTSVHSGHLEFFTNHGLLAYGVSLAILFVAMARSLRLKGTDRAGSFLLLSSLTYISFRTMFNTGWMSAGVVGFAFIALIHFSSVPRREFTQSVAWDRSSFA